MDHLRAALIAGFSWRSDPPTSWPWERTYYADYARWWREPDVLSALGAALAGLFPDTEPTVVMGVESRGSLLGPLVAVHRGVGFAEVRKQPERGSDDDLWFSRHTPPDYRNRSLELAMSRAAVRAGDRVLFVDDWATTGGQALACRQLVADAGAHWVGAAVIVDALESAATRRELHLRGILHHRELA